MSEPRRLWTARAVLTACLAAYASFVFGNEVIAQVAGAHHVVLIGVDGLSPDGIRKAVTPHLHQLMKAGASTLHARAVLPTVSSPNWASMIAWVPGLEQHGITTDDWEPNRFEIMLTATGSGGTFPAIFGLLCSQRPSSQIACFHDCAGFARSFEQKVANIVEHPGGTPSRPLIGPSPTLRRKSPILHSSTLTTLTVLATTTGMAHRSITKPLQKQTG